MSNKKRVVSIAGVRQGETAKALCIIPEFIDGHENVSDRTVWIPLSCVCEIHHDRIVIEEWMAIQKGLVEGV